VAIVFVSSIILSMGAISAQSAQQSYMIVAKKKDDKGILASTVIQSRGNSDSNTRNSIVRDNNNTNDNLPKDLVQSCPDGSELVKGKCACPDGSEISKGKCICPNDDSSPINGKCPEPSPPGSLTFLSVIKKVTSNDGSSSTKKPSDFTITVSGNNPSPSSFSGSSSGTSVTLKSGSYKVGEDNSIPGYTTSYSSGCSGTAKGGHIQCTIINKYTGPPPGSTTFLDVITNVIDNNQGTKKPSDFTITVSGNNPSPSSFSGSSSGTSVTLRAGSYKVTETEGPSGYTTSYSSGCSGTIDAGQTEECAITNEANKSPQPKPLVTTIRGFSDPLGLAYDSNNKHVYVTNYGGSSSSSNADTNKVSVIDTSSDKVIDTVSVGKKPLAITYNPNNNHVYVANTFSDTISVIDTLRNNNVISNIAVAHFPGNSSSGIAYNSKNGNMYVANIGSDSVSEIDGSNNVVTSSIKQLSNPAGIAYDSANDHIYITNNKANTVSVIDTLRNNKVIATIPVGISPSSIIFDADNNHVYVANTGSDNSRDTVSVIDTSTNKVIATILVGNAPNGITLDSSRGKIYVTNTFSNNVSVIDDSNNKVTTTISVGTNPYGIVSNPSNHHIYVANHGSNTISVISP
jgi:YVTN family beta-propeller protein